MWPFLPEKLSQRELGRVGERRAAWYYRLRGWRVVARNVRTRRGELDLVVRRGRTVAFVEVKTRQTLVAGEGWASVTPEKEAKLYELATEFMARQKLDGCQVRFDVVSILRQGQRLVLTHFADAFQVRSDETRPWKVKRRA
jgi:putative endonuclease